MIPPFVNEVLYKEQPDDRFHQLVAVNDDRDPARVNLSAITYYATLGMKPHHIGPLVGTTGKTIWANSALKMAFVRGQAQHVLWHRDNLHQFSVQSPSLSRDALDRAVPPDLELEYGMDPTDLQARESKPLKIEYNIVTNQGKERDAIEAVLQERITAAQKEQEDDE